MRKTALIASLAATVSLAGVLEAKTIKIGIGHQSMCTDTYTAGIIVKELKLLEKHLPKTGKYKDADYQIKWADYSNARTLNKR